jgi:hypothetical protein
MITDTDRKSNITLLERAKLPIHWQDYFEYETNDELSNLTKNEFHKIINNEKSKAKPIINSQIIIAELLTKFGKEHNFHRQFRENFPNMNSAQILGMQLYDIIVQDNDIWTIIKQSEKNHLFSHTIYFK